MAVVKRRSNSASPLDLGKALKFFFPTGLSRQQIWNKGTCEEIVIQYEDFLMEMILLSVRPTKTWILGACEKTLQKCDKDICGSFAQRFSEVASFCHRRKLRMKTGQKFPPAIRRIVKAMSKKSEKDPQGLGEKLLAHAKKRTLEKKISIASTPSPKRRKKAATPLASLAPARETSVEELYAGLLQSSDQLLQQKSEETVFVSSGEEGHMTKHIFLYLLLLQQAQHCQFKAKAFGLTQCCTLLSEEGMLLVTWSLLSARQVTKALCLPDSKEKIGSRLKCPLCNGKNF